MYLYLTIVATAAQATAVGEIIGELSVPLASAGATVATHFAGSGAVDAELLQPLLDAGADVSYLPILPNVPEGTVVEEFVQVLERLGLERLVVEPDTTP